MSRNRGKPSKMNLTSLMDVFTILVFFLLVNSGSVELVEAPKNVSLPESMVEEKPRETVIIAISPEEVTLQGETVAMVAQLLDEPAAADGVFRDRLNQLSGRVIGTSTMAVAKSHEVTILADKSVPFIVIRRIMSLCTSEGYENVSLAVVQKPTQVASR